MSAERAREYLDTVLRKQAFEKAHPHVHIAHQAAPLWHWLASWRDDDGAERVKVDHELKGLLDSLDREFPDAIAEREAGR